MKNLTKTIVIFMISIVTNNVIAQDDKCKIMCQSCVEGLEKSAYDKYSLNSRETLYSMYNMYFSMTDEQRDKYKNSNSTSAGAKLLIDDIPVGFNFKDTTSEEYRKFKKITKEFKESSKLSQDNFTEIFQKVVNKYAISTYEACITSAIRQCGGPNAVGYFINGDIEDEFILTVNWRPINAITQSKIATFEYTNLAIKNGLNIFNGADFIAFTPLTQTFKRINPNKKAAISISFVGLGSTISIDFDETDKTSFLPIGTIIASTLNYQQFTQQPFDEKKSTWAPADGRSVPNSKYGLTINPNVPDLRGQFLRGLNQFYSPGEPKSVTNEPDPNDLRTTINEYSYQKQSFSPHSHGITDNKHTHSILNQIGISGAENGGNNMLRQASANSNPHNLNTEQSTSNITINASGQIETRPNNIAVYYYIKIK